MELSEFRPKSQLVTAETRIVRPRFPVIDAHNHLGEPFGATWDQRPVSELLELLDQAHVRLYVDLDGGWGEHLLNSHLDHFKAYQPERFRIFGGVDWGKWTSLGNGFPDWAAGRLRAQKARGAEGLKIWKPFGLHVRDHKGDLVRINDCRLDVVWATAGEIGLPVLIHVADPVAFFDPLDETNERWEELHAHPDWQFPSPPFPSFMGILDDFLGLVRRHPETSFIGAHFGAYAENLAWVGTMLDLCPNYSIDISERIGELGRQPYSTRSFFLKYADRILFGLDLGPNLGEYRLYYRFLETADEYFNYNASPMPRQGRWRICGLNLPDDVLKKIYYNNAARLFGIPELPSDAEAAASSR